MADLYVSADPAVGNDANPGTPQSPLLNPATAALRSKVDDPIGRADDVELHLNRKIGRIGTKG